MDSLSQYSAEWITKFKDCIKNFSVVGYQGASNPQALCYSAIYDIFHFQIRNLNMYTNNRTFSGNSDTIFLFI